MKKLYSILNLVIIVGMVIWNYVANSMGINGNTVGELSDELFNLFTPAGYAFSIWGIIFIALIGHGIFQVQRVFFSDKDDSFVETIGPWLIIANLANSAWLWFWLTEQTGVTIFIMLTLLISLLMIVIKLNMQLENNVSKAIKWWVWTPISLYSGWIAVATIANFSAYLAKLEWQAIFSETIWAVIMIVIATVVNLLMLNKRKMPVFAGVGVWAILAIAARHWNEIAMLQWTAVVCAVVLVLAIVQQVLKK